MLALILAAICIVPGSSAEVVVDLPVAPPYGGTLFSDDPSVAEVTGRWYARNYRATVHVQGKRKGEAKLWMRYVWGFYMQEAVVGDIIVDDALGMIVSPAHAVVGATTPVLLSALTTGPHVTVVWFEGNRFLGAGQTISLVLPLGIHHVRAEGSSPCGFVASETEIRVVKPRRRALRH